MYKTVLVSSISYIFLKIIIFPVFSNVSIKTRVLIETLSASNIFYSFIFQSFRNFSAVKNGLSRDQILEIIYVSLKLIQRAHFSSCDIVRFK